MHNAQPLAITALLPRPTRDGLSPDIHPACPALTSLIFLTVYIKDHYNLVHTEQLMELIGPFLGMSAAAYPLTTLTSLSTTIIAAPSLLVPVSLTFPFLTTLRMSCSDAILEPAHIHRLFSDLPLLHTLEAQTDKTGRALTAQQQQQQQQDSNPSSHTRQLAYQASVDQMFKSVFLPLISRCRAAWKRKGQTEASPFMDLPPPARLPPSARLTSLCLGHVSYTATLAPLGTHFPKLEQLECWAVTRADFVGEGPSGEETAAHQSQGSGSDIIARPVGNKYSACVVSDDNLLCLTEAQLGRAWLRRFPALRTLTLWMDPRDLPCRSGVRYLHLELPRLR